MSADEQPTWTPTVDVGPQRAGALIRRAWPDLADEPLEPYGIGWDNTVYRLGRAGLVRMPHREVSARLFEHELAALGALADRLPLPVPRVLRRAEPLDGHPFAFALYAELPGRTACRARLDRAARAHLADPLGRFLRALHSTPLDDAERLGLPLDELRRMDPTLRLPRARKLLSGAPEAGLVDDPAPLAAYLEAFPADWRPRTDALVHGDLYARHVLVSTSGEGNPPRACGVIDWGDVHRGDRGVDLALALQILLSESRGAFEAAYGPIEHRTWVGAGLRALQGALNIGQYGARIGDRALVDESRVAIELWSEWASDLGLAP